MASYNVQALPDYVDQNRPELIAKAVMGAKSADLFNLVTGVKGPTALNLISSEISIQDGSVCGWEDKGTTSLSQTIMNAKPLKVNMSICDKVLLNKWAGYLVKVQANKLDRDLPFEEYFIDDVIKNVKAQIETMIYQGAPAANDQFEGLLNSLASDAITVDVSGAASTYEAVQMIAAAMPVSILGKDDLAILLPMDKFMQYMQDLVGANLYHYNPGNGDNEYMLPGTNIRVIGVNGLNGSKSAIAASLSNLYYGINMEDGDEVFDLWYSKDNREFRLAIEFVAGTAAAWPNEVVVATF